MFLICAFLIWINIGKLPFCSESMGTSQVALEVKNPPADAGDINDVGLIPGWGRSPGGGHGNPLQYSWSGESHGYRCLVGYGPQGHTELDTALAAQHSTAQSNCESVSGSVVSDSLRSHGLQPAKLLCPWNSLGKNTGVGSHSLLQGIFPTRGSNAGLLHCKWILYSLSHHSCTILYSSEN